MLGFVVGGLASQASSGTGGGESSKQESASKAFQWLATGAMLYAVSSMIWTLVNILAFLVASFRPGVGSTLAVLGLGALFGTVGWLMALPALVALALGLMEMRRSAALSGSEMRVIWTAFGTGVGLFVATIPFVVLIATARSPSPVLVSGQLGIGVTSAVLLLYAMVLPGFRRGSESKWSPFRIGFLLGIAAAVVESIVGIGNMNFGSMGGLSAAWPPLSWGFPAGLVVITSGAVLGWAYYGLAKAMRPSQVTV